MSRRTYSVLVFLIFFGVLLIAQFAVHRVANDPLVFLLPGDGCGQVLNYQLKNMIELALWVAFTAATLSAFFLAKVIVYGRSSNVFILSSTGSLIAFLAGGTTHLKYFEHLISCDVFFMGSDAAFLNFAAAGVLLLLTVAVLIGRRAPNEQ